MMGPPRWNASACYCCGVRACVLLLCSLAGLALGAGGCVRTCPAVGCEDSGVISGEMAEPSGAIVIELCFNGACRDAKTLAAPNPPMCTSIATGTISGEVCFESGAPNGTLSLSGLLNLRGTSLHDSDRYRLTITDTQTGAILGLADQTGYDDSRVGCDECKLVRLKVAPP